MLEEEQGGDSIIGGCWGEESRTLWGPIALRDASMEDVGRGETSDLGSKRSERGQGASRKTGEEAAARPQERQ